MASGGEVALQAPRGRVCHNALLPAWCIFSPPAAAESLLAMSQLGAEARVTVELASGDAGSPSGAEFLQTRHVFQLFQASWTIAQEAPGMRKSAQECPGAPKKFGTPEPGPLKEYS